MNCCWIRFLLLACAVFVSKQSLAWASKTSDPKATQETQRLLRRLHKMMNGNIYIGHQNATLQGLHWKIPNHQNQKPDMTAITGVYPHVVGFDFGNFKDLDKLPYKHFLPQVKEAHNNGAIVTFSWHMFNPITGVKPGAETFKQPLLDKLLPGGNLHTHLRRGLNKIAAFAHQAKDNNGASIPILFRPFHEYNGDWFWWSNSPPSHYIKLWKYVWSYLTQTKKVHNFLYSFSPSAQYNKRNHPSYFYGYPGHAFVDVLGLDCYQNDLNDCVPRMREVVVLAQHAGKVAALTETGWKDQQVATYTGNYWLNKVLRPLLGAPIARHMAYLLYWRNARLDHHYLPYPKGAKGKSHRTTPSFQAMMKHSLLQQSSAFTLSQIRLNTRNPSKAWKPRIHLLASHGRLIELLPTNPSQTSTRWRRRTYKLQGLPQPTHKGFHSYYDPYQRTQKLVVHTTTGALIHYSLLPLLGQRKASSQPWKFTLLQASSCQPKSKKPEGETGKNVCRKTPTAEHAGAVAPRGIVWVSMGLELVFHINLSGHLILHSKDTQKQTWKRDNLCLGLELPRLTGHPFVYLRTLDHVITVVVEGLDGNVYSFQARNGIRNWLVRTITEVLPREPQTKGPFTFVINPNNARGQLLFPGSHTAYQSLSLQPPHTTQWTYGDAPLLFPRRTGITKVINATQPNQQNCFGGQSLAGEIQAVVVNKDNKTTRWNPGKKSRSKLGNRLLGAIWTKGPQCHVFYQNSKRQVWTLRWSKEGWRHTNLSRTLGLPKEPLSLSVYQAPSPATL